MDLLRALSSPNVDICKKTLDVAMDLVGPRNIEEVVQVSDWPPHEINIRMETHVASGQAEGAVRAQRELNESSTRVQREFNESSTRAQRELNESHLALLTTQPALFPTPPGI